MYLLLILLIYFHFSCDIMLSLYFVYMLAGFIYSTSRPPANLPDKLRPMGMIDVADTMNGGVG